MRPLYRLIAYLAAPVVFAYFLWRSWREPAYRRDWAQRLGYSPSMIPTGTIWIHAASVGEVQAIAPIIDDLLDRPETPPLLITTMTPSGRERLRERFGDRVSHSYLPLDLPGAVQRFLARTRPRHGLVVEMELWPELLSAAHARGLPLHLVNARLSARSLRRYQRLTRLLRPALMSFDWIGAQTDDDADRLVILGAPRQCVTSIGNIKFDQPIDEAAIETGQHLRAALGTQRPIWAATSTRDGEEAIALAAHARIRETLPDAGLILVPRHPQRFQNVAKLIQDEDWIVGRRSDGAQPAETTAVFLGDSMGEMGVYMAAADAVFVGGSLVPLGGQNMLEAAALERPVLAGPHRWNFAAAGELLEHAGGLTTVAHTDELAERVGVLLRNDEERERRAAAARACVEANQGARRQIRDQLLAALSET